MTIAAATAAFRDSLPGAMGIMTRPVHSPRSSGERPWPSLPMATAARESSAERISSAPSARAAP